MDEDINHSSGVVKKVNSQIEEWVNHKAEVFVLSIATTNSTGLENHITEKASLATTFICTRLRLRGTFFNMWNKVCSVYTILHTLREIKPDVIYLREMICFPGLIRITKIYPTIMEANTIFVDEARLGNPIRAYVVRMCQPILYKSLKGVVGVTNEISNHFSKFKIPLKTIANGISFSKNGDIYKSAINDRPQIVFVGTPGMPWHGADLYHKMAQLIPDADFHLIGPIVTSKKKCGNFFQYGYLGTKELNKMYSTMDIAVGSLALFRNNMEEACVLKVREYLKAGLPVIIGYNDVDIDHFPFVLRIGNSEGAVEERINDIRKFILDMQFYKVPHEIIRDSISVEIKEKNRINFIQSVIFAKAT